MTLKKIYMIIGMLLVWVFLVGCASVEPPIEEVEDESISVKAAKPFMKEVIKDYITIGEVMPNNQLDITVSGTGNIEKVYVEAGDLVSENEAVIRLTEENFTRTLNATESQLRTIRDNLKTQVDNAEKNYTDQKKLFEAGAISQSAVDTASSQLETLTRQYNDARTNYSNQVRNLKQSVNDRIVRSPIKGTVAVVNIKAGQTVNNQVALTIIDVDQLHITTFITGDLKRVIDKDTEVKILLDGYGGDFYMGTVAVINELPDMQSKLFEVAITFDSDKVPVVVGDYAEIEFVLERRMASVINSTAVIREGSRKYIFVIKDGLAKKVEIETGLTVDKYTEFWLVDNKDLDIENIVVKGQFDLVEGNSVKIEYKNAISD